MSGTSGAGKNEGRAYENVLLTYLLLKCVWDKDCKKCILMSNHNLFGSADDVILVYNDDVYLIQMKWTQNPGNNVDSITLMSYKNKISLVKECKSYKSVKDNLKAIQDIIGDMVMENITLVIFTNGTHHKNMGKESILDLGSQPNFYFAFDDKNLKKPRFFRFMKPAVAGSNPTIYEKFEQKEKEAKEDLTRLNRLDRLEEAESKGGLTEEDKEKLLKLKIMGELTQEEFTKLKELKIQEAIAQEKIEEINQVQPLELKIIKKLKKLMKQNQMRHMEIEKLDEIRKLREELQDFIELKEMEEVKKLIKDRQTRRDNIEALNYCVDYCNQMVMCTGQPEPDYIKQRSQDILGAQIKSFDSYYLYHKIYDKVKLTFEKSKDKKIDRNHFIQILDELIVRHKHLRSIESDVNFVDDCKKDLKEKIMNEKRLILYSKEAVGTMKCKLKHLCRDKAYFDSYKITNFIYFHLEHEEELVHLTRYLENNPDKILIFESNDLKYLNQLSSSLPNVSITGLTREKVNISGWTRMEISSNFPEIENKDKIMKKNVMLQGKSVKFGEVINVENCNINGLLLEQLLFQDNVSIGDGFDEFKCQYETRYLKYSTKFTDDISKLPGGDQNYFITNSTKFINNVVTESVIINQETVHVYQNIIFSTKFNKNVIETFNSIHWMEEVDGILEWRRTYGEETLGLKEVITRTCTDVEVFSSVNRLLVVVDEPSCGKSITLDYLASNYKESNPNRIVIKIKLRDHYDYFEVNKLSAYDDVINFIKHVFDKQKFRKNFVTSCLNIKETIVLVDGFNEVCPTYCDVVINLIDNLLQYSCVGKILVTSRPNVDVINTFDNFSFVALSKLSQINILSNYLSTSRTQSNNLPIDSDDDDDDDMVNDNNIDLEVIKSFAAYMIDQLRGTLDRNHVSLLNNPLNIEMLGYQYQDQIREYVISSSVPLPKRIDLFSLCENFLTKKIETYVKRTTPKSTPNFDNIIKRNKIQINEECMFCGLSSLNLTPQPYDISEVMNDVQSGDDKYGLISFFKDNKPYFVHRLFAEYYSALYFKNNFSDVKEYIQNELKKSEMKYIKYIFDLMLSEKTPLLRNIICQSHDIVDDNINVLDLAGRNIIHIAVQYKDEKTIGVVLGSSIHRPALLTARDDMFGWTPMQYAAWGHHKWDMINILCKYGDNINAIDITEVLVNKVRAGHLLFSCITYDRTHLLKQLMDGHQVSLLMFSRTVSSCLFLDCDINFESVSALEMAAGSGSVQSLRLLLNYKRFYNVDRSLYFAICNRNMDCVETLLQHVTDINMLALNVNPLIRTIELGLVDMVELLINARADINICYQGSYPIHVAINESQLAIVRILIKKGVREDVKHNGHTAVTAALLKFNNEDFRFAFENISEKDIKRNMSLYLPLVALGMYPLNLVQNINEKDISGLTLLMYYVLLNKQVEASILLTHYKVDVDIVSSDGESCLTMAGRLNRLSMIRLLLKHKADPNEPCNNKLAVHWAVIHRNLDMIELLMENAKADINNNTSHSPLWYAIEDSNNEDVVEYLFDKDINVNWKNTKSGDCILTHAVKWSNELVIDRLLSNDNILVDEPNKDGDTPLIIAAKYKRTSIALKLLIARATLNFTNKEHKSCLYYALESDNHQLARSLLDYEPNYDYLQKYNKIWSKILNYLPREDAEQEILIQVNRPEDLPSDEHLDIFSAVKQRKSDVVEKILLQEPNCVNIQDSNGNTPLFYSLSDIRITGLLLKADATINISNNKQVTPLMKAIKTKHYKLVLLLINSTTVKDCMNTQDDKGWTALHYAAMIDHTLIIYHLIKLGADVNVKNNEQDTPFALAVRNNFQHTIAVFLSLKQQLHDDNLKSGFRCALKGESTNLTIVVCLIEECQRRGCLELPVLPDKHLSTVLSYIDLDQRDENGNTLLHRFSSSGRSIESVRLLIKHGADINLRNQDKRTPLMLAVLHDKTEVVRVLVEQVDVDVTDRTHCTALDIAKKKKNKNREIIELLERIDRRNKEVAKKSSKKMKRDKK